LSSNELGLSRNKLLRLGCNKLRLCGHDQTLWLWNDWCGHWHLGDQPMPWMP
jgi:hypothetical protein